MRFIAGLLVGLVLGVTGSSVAAQMVGSSGWLMGFDVTLNGDVICRDPYIWVSYGEIECD